VEVVGTRLSAMAYVGHGICASGTLPLAQRRRPSQRESRPEATIPTRRLRAPLTDEH
jgi:hypothetical protein